MNFKNLAFTLSVLLVFSGCESKSANEEDMISTPKEQKAEPKKEPVKKVKTEFVLKTTAGKNITLSFKNEGKVISIKEKEYQDKAILLDFFATWCPPCKAEIPHLNNLREKYKGKFEIIGILLEDGKPKEEVKDFMFEYNINYPITLDADNRGVAGVFGGVRSIPFMVMYKPDGSYNTHYTGAVPEEMIDINIQEALGMLK
jgi:thiol-disulfide isomerase/thioredoxin